MTKYLLNHTSKLLFPHLARDQRKQQLKVIMLVFITSLCCAGSLAMWMILGRR
ncbi:MAG: hypothetical protein WBN75_11865 [Verrucomicrobiia bacterium]|jgi:hypothetical protein